jgi:hypothetical protein
MPGAGFLRLHLDSNTILEVVDDGTIVAPP